MVQFVNQLIMTQWNVITSSSNYITEFQKNSYIIIPHAADKMLKYFGVK